MIEIYLMDGCEEESLRKFLEKITGLNLAYTIKKIAKKPRRYLSCYVEGAYKQAGIWGLPVELGTMRLLCASELVGPIHGQSLTLKRKDGIQKLMFASHPDAETLCSIALHELGHALKAVRKSTHNCVTTVKAKKELAAEITKTLVQQGTLEKLGKLYPESMVELGGSHCLEPACVMQVYTASSAITAEQPFCDLCFENVKNEIKKVNEEFEAVKNKCGDCVYLKRCMQTKEWVWDGSDPCDEFEQDHTLAEKKEVSQEEDN